MAKNSFLMQQKIAVGVIAFIVVAAVIYFSTIVVQDAPLGEFVEGEHYFELEEPRRIRGDQIEVMEFFSYACVHCYNFDPEIQRWANGHGDRVNLIQTPAIASDYWRLLGRHYYTMQSLGVLEQEHYDFFRQIHDASRQFPSAEALAGYMSSQGISAEDYRAAFNSDEVIADVDLADRLARRLKVASVPTVIVHGRYVVQPTRSVGPARMLDVMDHLLRKIEAEQAGSGS